MKKPPRTEYYKYRDDTALWETKQLGASAEHAKQASAEDDKVLDDDLGLTPISLRLQKGLVAKLKILAAEEGLGYQTYIRVILTRHASRAVSVRAKKQASA